MKKLIIFLSFTSDEIHFVCEKMANKSPCREFLGFWSKIESNNEECLNAISYAVNHFLDSDKEEICFGVDKKDLDELLLRINTDNCEIIKINAAEINSFGF